MTPLAPACRAERLGLGWRDARPSTRTELRYGSLAVLWWGLLVRTPGEVPSYNQGTSSLTAVADMLSRGNTPPEDTGSTIVHLSPGLLLLPGLLAAPGVPGPGQRAQRLHQMMDHQERSYYFGGEDPGDYEVADISEPTLEEDGSRSLSFHAHDRTFKLRLQPNYKLMAPQAGAVCDQPILCRGSWSRGRSVQGETPWTWSMWGTPGSSVTSYTRSLSLSLADILA